MLTDGGIRTEVRMQLFSTAGQPARLPVVAHNVPLDYSLPGPEGVDADERQPWHIRHEVKRRYTENPTAMG